MIDVLFVTVSCFFGKCYTCNNEDLNDPQHAAACMDEGSSVDCDLDPIFGSGVGNSSFVHVFHISMCGLQLINFGATRQVLFVHCKIVTQFEKLVLFAGSVTLFCKLSRAMGYYFHW